MERLTHWESGKSARLNDIPTYDLTENLTRLGKIILSKALNRLAKYEDLELEPEEITDLISCLDIEGDGFSAESTARDLIELMKYRKLKEQGRLVELPCNIEKPLYKISGIEGSAVWIDKIYAVSVEMDATGLILINTTDDFCGEEIYLARDIGRRIFLTQEEAEKALKER